MMYFATNLSIKNRQKHNFCGFIVTRIKKGMWGNANKHWTLAHLQTSKNTQIFADYLGPKGHFADFFAPRNRFFIDF